MALFHDYSLGNSVVIGVLPCGPSTSPDIKKHNTHSHIISESPLRVLREHTLHHFIALSFRPSMSQSDWAPFFLLSSSCPPGWRCRPTGDSGCKVWITNLGYSTRVLVIAMTSAIKNTSKGHGYIEQLWRLCCKRPLYRARWCEGIITGLVQSPEGLGGGLDWSNHSYSCNITRMIRLSISQKWTSVKSIILIFLNMNAPKSPDGLSYKNKYIM